MELKAALVGCGAMSRAWLQAAAQNSRLAHRRLGRPRRRTRQDAAPPNSRCKTSSSPKTFTTLLSRSRPDLLFDVVVPAARHERRLRRPRRGLSRAERKADGRDARRRARSRRARQGRRPHPRRRAEPPLFAGRPPHCARRCVPARSARSPAFTPISFSRRISAAFARRWITSCCSTWRSTASTPCAA